MTLTSILTAQRTKPETGRKKRPGKLTAKLAPPPFSRVLGLAAGTELQSNEGPLPVDFICPGDVLVTVRQGGKHLRGVVWNNSLILSLARHPASDYMRPVRIKAGAIADGVPARDLRLGPDHGVYLMGRLFTAKSLINGCSIIQEAHYGPITYHQIELDTHDILLAEGLAVESFCNPGREPARDPNLVPEEQETRAVMLSLHARFSMIIP